MKNPSGCPRLTGHSSIVSRHAVMSTSFIRRSHKFSAIIASATLILAVALLHAVDASRSAMRRVNHSATVLKTTGDVMSMVQQTESASRGFALTRDPRFASAFDGQIAQANRAASRLVILTADNPAQQRVAIALRHEVNLRMASLVQNVQLLRARQYEHARVRVASGYGLMRMGVVNDIANRFIAEERRLENARIDTIERQLRATTRIVVGGVVIVILMIMHMTIRSARDIRRPIQVITDAMSALAAGQRDARVEQPLRMTEFDKVASGYNRMADELARAVNEQRSGADHLRKSNLALQESTAALQERGEAIELLGGMAHRMQAARTDSELADILRVFVPRVLPDQPGALYAHNNSRNLLVPIGTWGGLQVEPTGFAPDECWALRRGQGHSVGAPGSDIVCRHLNDDKSHYHCEPLLAAGEVIGVIYLCGELSAQQRFSLTVMTENIASALVNQRLQRGLREQTIRDPLTGLFNRRYMEETLAIEVARAARSGGALSVIMCDIDHFKRFNDDFGHDAGDAVLSVVAAEMATRFRDGDVLCRYGGEEFTIIAAGSTLQQMADRAEMVRKAIAELQVHDRGRSLGAITMSFGIASWSPSTDRKGAALIQAADVALYRAKREGRNRVVMDCSDTTNSISTDAVPSIS